MINATEIENNSTTISIELSSTDNNLTTGDRKKGEKIFLKYLQSICNISASNFSATHSQDEWEEIAESGHFKETVIEICPAIKETYKDEWTSHLYQFTYEYANDSGNIPEC
jgi:hypothetical protein